MEKPNLLSGYTKKKDKYLLSWSQKLLTTSLFVPVFPLVLKGWNEFSFKCDDLDPASEMASLVDVTMILIWPARWRHLQMWRSWSGQQDCVTYKFMLELGSLNLSLACPMNYSNGEIQRENDLVVRLWRPVSSRLRRKAFFILLPNSEYTHYTHSYLIIEQNFTNCNHLISKLSNTTSINFLHAQFFLMASIFCWLNLDTYKVEGIKKS